MADLFLSYASQDRKRAQGIAQKLASFGWSVFWDRRIPHGQDFSSYIQQQIDDARCIIVLWSKTSVLSAFVRDEANEGKNGRLVPALIENVKQPIGFRQFQAADLTAWSGDVKDEEFDRLVTSIWAIVAPPQHGPTKEAAGPSAKSPDSAKIVNQRVRGWTLQKTVIWCGVILSLAYTAVVVANWVKQLSTTQSAQETEQSTSVSISKMSDLYKYLSFDGRLDGADVVVVLGAVGGRAVEGELCIQATIERQRIVKKCAFAIPNGGQSHCVIESSVYTDESAPSVQVLPYLPVNGSCGK